MTQSITANKALAPGSIGDLQLRNRFIRAGCFEGMSPGGRVTPDLIEHHRRVAAGGAAMTTVAYCSVSLDGRAFDHELWMRPEIVPGLRNLTAAVHREGAAASIQSARRTAVSPSIVKPDVRAACVKARFASTNRNASS